MDEVHAKIYTLISEAIIETGSFYKDNHCRFVDDKTFKKNDKINEKFGYL